MDYDKSILQALEMVGQFVMREAVNNVTNNTKYHEEHQAGTLANSISYRVNPEDNSVEIGVFAGTAASNYAPYVEFGTGIHAKNGDGRKTPWGPFPNIHGYVPKEDPDKNKVRTKKKYNKTGKKRGPNTGRSKTGEPPKFLYTHGMEPEPFLGPALRDNEAEIKEVLRRALLYSMRGGSDND